MPRRLIEFTHAGDEINAMVTGINVGGLAYWKRRGDHADAYRIEVVAVDGSFASVIGGGAAAAAVVFGAEVRRRTEADQRLADLRSRIARADGAVAARLRAELEQIRPAVKAEKQAEVASEFDQVHNIERAMAVGSVDAIISPAELRPYLIGAVERGIRRVTADAT